jgi:hypothetical protein
MTYDEWKQKTPPENKVYLSFGPEEEDEEEAKECEMCYNLVEDPINDSLCQECKAQH